MNPSLMSSYDSSARSQVAQSAKSHKSQQLYEKGIELMMRRRYGEALQAFERAIRVQPDWGALWYHRGDALANLERYQDALDSFQQALVYDADNPRIWVFQAVTLLHLHRVQAALEACDRALKIAPEDREAWLFRGVALHRLNRYGEAYTSYKRALGKSAMRPGDRLRQVYHSCRQQVRQRRQQLQHWLRK
jgi:tetratricopeptide (TPR) repeat protein